jgi:hypothetical protein
VLLEAPEADLSGAVLEHRRLVVLLCDDAHYVEA